jgi:hypothetical protein
MPEEDIMPPADLLRLLRAQPYVPFRIHVDDGRVFEVRHPEFCMVGTASAIVATPDSQNQGLYSSYEILALRHFSSLEPLPAAQAG